MNDNAYLAELKELEKRWNDNLKTKDKAGCNSKDNERMIIIRAILKSNNVN